MERSTVRGSLHKHLDLERKIAKQAEARLRQRLQSLEDICLLHLKLLIREQRQLQREQQRLQQGEASWQYIVKVRLSSLGNGTQKRPECVLSFPPQQGQKHRPPKHEVRALATNTTQEMYKIKSQMPPLCHTGLKNPTRRKENWRSPSHRTACFMAEKLPAQEKESVIPPQGIDPNKDTSVAHQDQMASSSTCGSGMVNLDEIRSKDASLKPWRNAVEQLPPHSVECVGGCKGETTKPAFSELFAKVKNARYLRHRVLPQSERLLSIREIFGYRESSPEDQERLVKMVPSKFPPL
ncbi:hypothetical protein H1C71_038459 [Ictidomys tridecemlineatus]|nr:hypothetical protein H1C71_038459 [Ictidomys tridecemlineatus]